MNKYYYVQFGQAYGESSYGDCVYNNTEACNETGTGTGSGADTNGSGGQLTDTGFMLLIIATIACVILFAALIIRIWRRPARQEAVQQPGALRQIDQDQR